MKNNKIFVLLLLYAIVATLTIFFFDGTGDSGDSIHHYLFAKFAPQHPPLFFNHWAKPVYVLLVSPFAQFGFVGVKLFNAAVSLVTIFFTFKIAQKLNIKNAIIGALILVFSPLCFVLTFSGLTEPLFAMFISIGLYAILADKFIIACLVVSFLPFVRSEGLIILGVFSLYLLLKREWKLIPLLLFGHIVYSIAGFFIYNDLLWVFNKIPYARLSSTYGSGRLFHFAEQLIYVVGVPIYILFWIGVVGIIWKSIKKRITIELQILVFLGFFSFFIAHSLFWYLGIFNSMGLKRVLIGVAPLMSIISLIGFNFITDDVFQNKRTLKLITQGLLTAYILIFPFTSNPAAINWERDLNLTKDQQSANQVAAFIAQNRKPNQCFVFAHPYLSEVLKIDHFDNNMRLELTKGFMNQIKTGDIVIWENWFAVVEYGVTKEYLDNNAELINLYNLSVWDNGREIIYSVYKRI